jgi:23S rRNA (cytidine1920-2'-O)/16S rRNA (cytidine1409-2'-O)-methyltransferase
VRDVAVRAQTIRGVVAAAAELGWACHGLVRSPIQGPAGNVEFLAWFAAGSGKTCESLLEAVDLK